MQGFDLKDKTKIFTDIDQSGAGLVFNYLFQGKEPKLEEVEFSKLARFSKLIEDRDLWKFSFKETKTFSAAVRSYPKDFKVWDNLKDRIDELCIEGLSILRFFDQKIEELLPSAYEIFLADSKVLTANCPWIFASDLANKLSENRPFGVTWYFDGKSKKFKFSLRSKEDGKDVSLIAKEFNGGGHKHSAGFELTVEEVDKLFDITGKVFDNA
jgi:oligoribonuclease NrnB/cAMP/cGMP phosphodiesterase (DHH superfamily)